MAVIGGAPAREEVQDPNAGRSSNGGGVNPIRPYSVTNRMRTGTVGQSAGQSAIEGFLGIAKEVVPGMVDQAVARQRAEGYIAASQGKGAVEVEEEQPWYSKLFGRSAAGRGALNYEAEAASQDYLAAAMVGMDKDREMTPDEYRKVLSDRAAKVSTGDPEIDAIVQTKLLQVSGQLATTQIKEHMQFQQEKAASARQQSYASAADAAAQMRNSADPNAYPTQVASMADTIKAGPVEGETQESSDNSLALAVASGLAADNPFMYEALGQSGHVLGERQQLLIAEHFRNYQQRQAARADASTVARMANVFSMVGKVDAQTLGDAAMELNAYQESRGGKPVFDAEGLGRLMASSQDQLARAQAAAQLQALGQQAKGHEMTLVAAAALNPQATSMYVAATGKDIPDQDKQAMLEAYRTNPGTKQWFDSQLGEDAELKIMTNLQYVDPGFAAAVTGSTLPNIGKQWKDLNGGAQFLKTLSSMEMMYSQSPGLAAKNFADPLLQSRFKDYMALREQKLPMDRAWDQTFASPVASGTEPRLDWKQINKSVSDWESQNGKLTALARAQITNPSNSAYGKYGNEAVRVIANTMLPNSSKLWDYIVPAVDDVSINSQLGNIDDDDVMFTIGMYGSDQLAMKNGLNAATVHGIRQWRVNRISRDVLTATPYLDNTPRDDLGVTMTLDQLKKARFDEIGKHVQRMKDRDQGKGPFAPEDFNAPSSIPE